MQPDGSVVVPFSPVGSAGQAEGGEERGAKKPRRVRLLLDARTELTNEELEVWISLFVFVQGSSYLFNDREHVRIT